MQKFTLLTGSLCALITLGIGLSSCKDDEPFVRPKLSVNTETLTVAEGAGTAQVEIVLDRAAPTDITIEYDLGGTATSPADYSISGNEGEIDIDQGQTSATVTIQIVSDAIYEGTETIELSLEDVSSTDVDITNDDEAVVTITDDDPQLQASFATTTLSVLESDNEELLELEVKLNGPAAQAVTIQYQLTHGAGFAVDDVYGVAEQIPGQYYDFEIEGGELEVVIPQGASSGNIQFQIYSDFHLEDPEKIEITLTQASNGVQIGTSNKMTVTVEQEDGKIVALVWDDDYTDVDMDLFLWVGEDVDNLGFAASSTNPDVENKLEILFIPKVIEDAAFGFSYTYYSGTQDPMDFESHFIDFVDGEVSDDLDVYPGTYNLDNINEWDEEGAPEPAIVQTLRKDAGQFVEITDINEPATSSRRPVSRTVLPKNIEKAKLKFVDIAKRLR